MVLLFAASLLLLLLLLLSFEFDCIRKEYYEEGDVKKWRFDIRFYFSYEKKAEIPFSFVEGSVV